MAVVFKIYRKCERWWHLAYRDSRGDWDLVGLYDTEEEALGKMRQLIKDRQYVPPPDQFFDEEGKKLSVVQL
jgi:hypothetical protein